MQLPDLPPATTEGITVRQTRSDRKEYFRQYQQLNLERRRLIRAAKAGHDRKIRQKWYRENRETILAKKHAKEEAQRKALGDSYRPRGKWQRPENFSLLRKLISNRLKAAVRGVGSNRKTKTSKVLGCTTLELKAWLEAQFEPWMTWDNRGSVAGKSPTAPMQCWDIDHFIPVSSAKSVEDVIRLHHHTNLRPLCSFENRWVKRAEIPQNPGI